MAVASDSTPAPAVQPRGLLPSRAETPRKRLLPLPAPLPSLSGALARRRAIFGPLEAEPASTALPKHRATPVMTADDFGMAPWWLDRVSPEEAQTARSDGDGPFTVIPLDVADLDSLDDARLRFARRMAADAVDHLIALMDAIDARTEDMEPQNEDGDPLDAGELDTADAEPSLGALEGRVDQRTWFGGGDEDREEGDDNGIADLDGYHEQCGYAVAGALLWSVGGYVA